MQGKQKKKNLNLLFDVGGPHDVIMADDACLRNGRHPGEFWTLAHFLQYLPNSYIKSEARTEFSGLFYIYSKISSFQTGLLHGLHLYKVGEMGLDVGPHDGPHQPSPMTATLVTAPQPHVNSHFVYI